MSSDTVKTAKAFLPLAPRTKESVKPEKNTFLRAFYMVSPILIYMLYVSLLTALFTYLMGMVADMSEDNARYLSANNVLFNAILRLAALLIATVMQTPSLLGEKPVFIHRINRSKETEPGQGVSVTSKTAVTRCIYCVILGASLALFFNIFIAYTRIASFSKVYESVAEKQFSLVLPMGILLYGIISPLAEEVVFRGLVYNRMRRDMGVYAAIIISSLLFGLYHFNIVQGIYGVLMALVIAWIYERYGGFIYPCLIHMGANTFIYILSATEGGMKKMMTPVTLIITGAISIVLIVYNALKDKP